MIADTPAPFTFKLLSVSDFPLLHAWLNTSHVLESWDKPGSIEEMHAKYCDKISSDWQKAYIVSADGTPFGYIQSYTANRAGRGWWTEEPQTTVGMDQFIGAPAFLGRGLGTAIAREFSDQLLEKAGVEKVIADPRPGNLRAIRCYKNAGFNEVGVVTTPDGRALLLEKRKRK